jgi:hypothetical protein
MTGAEIATMLFVAGSLSRTRIIAAAPHLLALVSCAIAWVGSRGAPHRRRLSAALTVVEAVLLLDTVFNGSLRVHGFLDSEAVARNVYDERFGPQHAALVVLGTTVVAAIGLLFRLFRGRPGAYLATFGCILSLCFWCVEVVSLHSVDSFLYHRVNGVTRESVVRSAFSLMTCVGILWDAFATRADARSGRCRA